MTLVKVFPKFECNIYLDIDFQSAISVSSTGNNRSFTALTDRLAFVNFSSLGPGTHAEVMCTANCEGFYGAPSAQIF